MHMQERFLKARVIIFTVGVAVIAIAAVVKLAFR